MAAFVHNGTRVAAYPKRARLPPTAPAPPAEDASYKDLNAPAVQVPSRGVTPHGKGPSPAPAMAARVAGNAVHGLSPFELQMQAGKSIGNRSLTTPCRWSTPATAGCRGAAWAAKAQKDRSGTWIQMTCTTDEQMQINDFTS